LNLLNSFLFLGNILHPYPTFPSNTVVATQKHFLFSFFLSLLCIF
jgi:hypothetical protein